MIQKRLIFIFCLLPLFLLAQTDTATHSFDFQIQGLTSSKVYLGYFMGEQSYVLDSALLDTTTFRLHYSVKRKLPEGLYFLANTEGVILDFVSRAEKAIQIQTTYLAIYDSATIAGSVDNLVFFQYKKSYLKTQQDINQMRRMLDMIRRATKDKTVLAEQERAIQNRQRQFDIELDSLIQTYPDLLTTQFLKALRLPNVADLSKTVKPYLNDHRPNPAFWHMFRQRFFEGIDFADSRLLHSPFYAYRLGQYLGYFPTAPDSVQTYLDRVLSLSRRNPEYYQFTLRWLTQVFDNQLDKTPNADRYLSYLYEKYHTDSLSGTDRATLSRLKYKSETFKPTFIGTLAPAISLPDTEGVVRRLYDVKSDYTLVIFYSSLCPHCREDMPKIRQAVQFVDPEKFKVFAVCTDGIKAAWLPFLKEMKIENWINVIDEKEHTDTQKAYGIPRLPVLYLLDNQKKVVLKWLKPENLGEILSQTHNSSERK